MTDKEKLLQKKDSIFSQSRQVGYKDGVEIEKGVILNEEYLETNESAIGDTISLFTAYPDVFIDLISPEDCGIKLFFYQRIFLRAAMRFQTVYVTACLKKGTPVLTERGMVPIEQVNVNERIWTKDGWQYPENLNMRDWHSDFYKISAQNCLQEDITVTDNHCFYAVPRENTETRPGKFWKKGLEFFNITNFDERKEFYRKSLREVEPQWIEAKDLKPNDWLLSPIDTEVKDLDFLSAPQIPNARCTNIIKEKIALNEEFFEWLGIWLAEGSWRGSGEITFTIHKDEERLANRIRYLTQSVFGLSTGGYVRENHNTQIIQINSKHLSAFLSELFECSPEDINQWNKWIPTKLLHCAPYKQLQLVKGWLDGDGYYRCKDGREYKGTTVSSALAEGIKMILYRNYINPSIAVEHRPERQTVYNVKFGGATAEEFENAINESRPVVITNEMRPSDYFPKKVGDKLFATNRVKLIERADCEDKEAWCLQMPNGSFNVAGVEGHNCRAWSKSFLTILALFLQCVFIPGRKVFICAPNKSQGAQIAKEKLTEIFRYWPLLRKEVVGGEVSDTPGNYGKDYVSLKFRNGSIFDVVGALESTLGGRRHSGLIDEIKNHDETAINTIVLPLLNVSRRLPDGTTNPKEPNQQVICATSAWQKTSFAYDRLIDNFEMSIMQPRQAFVFGCDYRVPVLHGLLPKDYVNQLKLSPSFNEVSFATEYLSLWQGASEEAWFNFDKLAKYRKLKNPETHAKNVAGAKCFYLLSVDVGRLHDQTVCCVFRVNITSDDKYHATLVNLYVLGRESQTKTFYQQVIDLKKIIRAFNPKEVVIDTNGLGIGFGDEMIRQQQDEFGEIYEPLGFINDEDFIKVQPKDAPRILYGLKANGPLNSKIHGNAYTRLNSGLVRFLIKEQEAKSALLATKQGQNMSVYQRIKRLMPHEMTTKLFEEMANLRLKRTGVSLDITLEQINPRYPKDKYSAFAYGLWRIKEIEEEQAKRRRRYGNGQKRQLIFCSGGV